MKSILTIVLVAAIAVLAACSFSSNTLAQSLIGLQAGLDSILPIVDPGIKTEVDNGFAAAISTAETWKSSTPATELVEAFSALAKNLDLIPQLNSKTDDIVAAAINFLDNEIALLNKTPTAQLGSPTMREVAAYTLLDDDSGAPPAYSAWITEDSGAPATSSGRKHQWNGKQIKSIKQLKAELKKLGLKLK